MTLRSLIISGISATICFTSFAGLSEAAPAKHAAKSAPPPSAQSHPATQQAHDAYLNRLRTRLQNNWYLPDGDNRVEITATVAADGTVDAVQVVSTPKSDAAQQAASDAFSKAQPLEALPDPGLSGARLVLVFSSKADPHGDSTSNITSKLETVKAGKASDKEPSK